MAIGGSNAVFKYKTVKGALHRLPAILKLFMLLPLSIFCMSLPPLYLAAGIATAAIIAFIFKFTLREQLTDLKPAVYYAVLMYALSVFSTLFDTWRAFPELSILTILTPRPDFLRIALRLFLIMQLSALLFRTTSSSEIRAGLNAAEQIIKRPFLCLFSKKRTSKSGFAENISLFLSFIPEIFETWTLINLAWKARGGKEGLGKIKTVVFVLISISMEKAAVKAKAIAARS